MGGSRWGLVCRGEVKQIRQVLSFPMRGGGVFDLERQRFREPVIETQTANRTAMTAKQFDRIRASIKKGTLAFTQENAEDALKAYADSIILNGALEAAGMAWLLDPTDEEGAPAEFEKWLVDAMRYADKLGGGKIRSEKKCRAFIHGVARQILADAGIKL